MAAKITIAFSDEVLRAMRKGAPIRLAMASTEGASSRAAAPKRRVRSGAGGKGAAPREGSLPARLVEWAASVGKRFGVADVVKALKIKRSHASMVLSRVVRDRKVRREGRGVYAPR